METLELYQNAAKSFSLPPASDEFYKTAADNRDVRKGMHCYQAMRIKAAHDAAATTTAEAAASFQVACDEVTHLLSALTSAPRGFAWSDAAASHLRGLQAAGTAAEQRHRAKEASHQRQTRLAEEMHKAEADVRHWAQQQPAPAMLALGYQYAPQFLELLERRAAAGFGEHELKCQRCGQIKAMAEVTACYFCVSFQ